MHTASERPDPLDLPGLERLRVCVAEGGLDGVRRLLGFRLVEVQPGTARMEGVAKPEIINEVGVIHGVFAMAMLDSVTGLAAISLMPAGVTCVTLETRVHFARAMPADVRVEATGAVVSQGRRVLTAEGRVVDPQGRVLAHGTSTLLVTAGRETPGNAAGAG